MAGTLKITQVRSAIGSKPKQRGTLRALGLRRINHTVEHPDKPEGRGMGARGPPALPVRAHAFSQGAIRAIETAGGQTETIPAPWGDRRPPARGNALSNR